MPDERTASGRRYDFARLEPEMFRSGAGAARKTIAYARVSSHGQKHDLERQKPVLERYCARQGWTFKVITDLGSGMNYHNGLVVVADRFYPSSKMCSVCGNVLDELPLSVRKWTCPQCSAHP